MSETQVCPLSFCGEKLAPADLRANLSDSQLCVVLDRSLYDDYVRCTSCCAPIEVYTEGDTSNEALRVRCVCGSNFCSKCNVSPFHDGMSCAEFEQSQPCRFCERRVPHDEDPVCKRDECQKRLEAACELQLQCGHPCPGCRGEASCDLDCLVCGGTAEEACIICLEPLRMAACIQSTCGHILHAECVKSRIRAGLESRGLVSLEFANCPLCKHPVASDKYTLQWELSKVKALEQRVATTISRERSKLTKEANAEIEDNKFAIYQCDKCTNVYFGGFVNCELALQEQERQHELEQGLEGNNLVNAQQGDDDSNFLCSSCTCASLQVPLCSEHGDVAMSFKCHFCCSPSTFFCWGTTHFCTVCHERQITDRLNLMHESEFAQCTPESCPLGVAHPLNGSKHHGPFILGCSLCTALHLTS